MGRCYIFVYTFGVCKIRHRNSRQNKLFRILKSLIVYMSRTTVIRFVFVFLRWTVNLALQTANEFFKSSSSFDASDLAQVCLISFHVSTS